jgi:UDP-N-acetylmuramate dehydrogenase
LVDSRATVVYDDPVGSVRNILEKINVSSPVRFDEPMSLHTSFQVGGPADIYAEPQSVEDLSEIVREARRLNIPIFTLGGGANILVSDAGIRGLVIDMRNFDELTVVAEGGNPTERGYPAKGLNDGGKHQARGENLALVRAGAGLPISDVAAWCADRGLEGLDFLYAMPGSVGGSLWMNARCYGESIVDVLREAEYVDEEGRRGVYGVDPRDFDYKKSPFQSRRWVIVSALFGLRPGDPGEIWSRMRSHQQDRTGKGHFVAPSAGSVFKNNRAFGSPTGKIIDELGLRGHQIGGARISDQHANIIVNAGGASAGDIRQLIEFVESEVHTRTGFELEREVLYAGEWPDGKANEDANEGER